MAKNKKIHVERKEITVLFENLKERLNLKLIKANIFKSGVVQLIYTTEKK